MTKAMLRAGVVPRSQRTDDQHDDADDQRDAEGTETEVDGDVEPADSPAKA